MMTSFRLKRFWQTHFNPVARQGGGGRPARWFSIQAAGSVAGIRPEIVEDHRQKLTRVREMEKGGPLSFLIRRVRIRPVRRGTMSELEARSKTFNAALQELGARKAGSEEAEDLVLQRFMDE
jgi:hypothetical protein